MPIVTPKKLSPELIRAAKTFYFAEHLGGLFYEKFAGGVDNHNIKDAFAHFSGDEYSHAEWYADWMRERNIEIPSLETLSAVLIPTLRAFLAPAPLESKLRLFAQTEALATTHLLKIAPRIRDASLRSIVEKTIPFERAHSLWYEKEGRKMLRAGGK